MTDAQRTILERVASGELDPQSATRLLDELFTQPETTELGDEVDGLDERDEAEPLGEERQTDDVPKSPRERHDDTEPVRGVRVVASAGSIRVVGDPLVARLAVEGPHTMRRSGDIVVVECSPLLDVLSFEHGLGRFVSGAPHPRRLRGGGRPVVVVRVNPDLPLDLDVTAGHAVVSGAHGAMRCSVSAGSAVLRDVVGPVEASVTAGSLTVQGPMRAGRSRVSCDMSSATIRLEPGADVRVRVRSNLGKMAVDLPEDTDGTFLAGDGTAGLDVESNLSSVTIAPDV